jgi:urea transport system permease protein
MSFVLRLLVLLGLICCGVATIGASRVMAQDFPALILGLGSEGSADKEAAIDGLGRLGDGRAIPALRALSDGRLGVAKDGRVVIADLNGQGFADAATAAPMTGLAREDVERVRVNNRLRNAINATLSKLQIFSPEPADRLAAAKEALKSPSIETANLLRQALAKETVSDVKRALSLALDIALLTAGSEAEQLAAVADLSGSSDPLVSSTLRQVAGQPSTKPALKDAIAQAVASIERRLAIIDVADKLFQGLSLGSVLLLAAIGLAITFGVMGVINMAHGEMIMLGAYTAFVVQEIFRAYLPPAYIGWYLPVALPAAFLVAGLVGVALERSVIRLLYGRPLETLLATWGISLMLQQAVRSIFGASNREVANPAYMTGGFDVMGGFFITWNRLVIIIFCFVVLAALAMILRRTFFGLEMRAVTQNRGMAKAMGIATDRVDAMTFGLGSGIAGIAGVALSQIGNVSPNLGQIYIIDSFMVVVFGGVGNLMGTLVGAMSLGVVNKLLEPYAGAVLGKIFVLVAIILFIQKRPRGLFALKGRSVES